MNQEKKQNLLNRVDVLILCGGLGTRLRPVVSDRPKAMAEVLNKPFLEIVVKKLLEQGFRRIIFCTGYMSDHVEEYFKKLSRPDDVFFEFSREEKPLGTGGALKNAFKLIKSDRFFVINGDTFSNLDFNEFYSGHGDKGSPLSIALVERRHSNGQGNVLLVKNDLIANFEEDFKEDKEGFASTGSYLMNKDIQKYFPAEDNFSLEHDLFPKLAMMSHGFVFDGKFLDIGTPDRYGSAEGFFS